MKEYKKLKKVNYVVKNKEKGTYHFEIDGKISKVTLDKSTILSVKKILSKENILALLKANVKYGINVNYMLTILNETVTDKKLYSNLRSKGYTIEKAIKKTSIKAYESIGNSLFIGYVPAGIVNQMYVIDEKEGVVKKDTFTSTMIVDKFSGEVSYSNIKYEKPIHFKIFETGTHAGLGYIVGLDKNESNFEVLPLPMDGAGYLKVVFHLSQIKKCRIYVSLPSFLLNSFYVIGYDDSKNHFSLKNPDYNGFAERMEEEWQDWKNEKIAKASEELNKQTDFDIN